MVYNPQDDAIVIAKPLGAVSFNIDSRSTYFDESTYTRRPFTSTAEVLAYFDTAFKRRGNFTILVDDGSGVVKYWFKDGVADSDLVLENVGGGGGGDSTPDATNSTKGKLKLTNHLGGTADLPTVVAVDNVTVGDSSSKPANTKFVADSIINKVDKVAGKSLILDTEITRLAGVTNQDISGKQNTLVSGSNIKTINGDSILGSGNLVVSGGGGGAVLSVAGKTGVVTLDKVDVGLGSVDNTSDTTKEVLSATKLKTPRNINGVAFDGTANITVATGAVAPTPTNVLDTLAVLRTGDTLSNIIDRYTKELFTFSKVTVFIDGSPMDDARVDGVMYIKFGSEYFRRNFTNGINVKWFGAVADAVPDSLATGKWTGTDNSVAIQAAINACGGSYDIGSVYIFKPADTVFIPKGYYCINNELVVTKNNTKITGEGMFDTCLICPKTVNLDYIIKFKGAYTSELSNITLDGGLPFTPNLTETYGADIGLFIDLAAFFVSNNLNIMNTRYEGARFIHLWESFFSNTRIHNLGFFGTALRPSAGIRFTLEGKEEVFFGGGESNQISFNKIAFGCVGTYVRMQEVPLYNVAFNDVIAEGRTWSQDYGSLKENKWTFGSTLSGVTINNGYTFAHHQAFNNPVKLFAFNNVGQGVVINNYNVYIEKDNTYPELETIAFVENDKPITINCTVTERGEALVKLINLNYGYNQLCGDFKYDGDIDRTRLSLFNSYLSELNYTGLITMKTPNKQNKLYDYKTGIGVSKYINMTAERVIGTEYTNTFNFPIYISYTSGEGGANTTIGIVVDGVGVATAQSTATEALNIPGVRVNPGSVFSYTSTGYRGAINISELTYF